jgi:hypothetical protein
MDTPPPLPGKKPLGQTFYILLLSPLLVMGIAVALAKLGSTGSTRDLGIPLSWLAMLGMWVCSILCAVIVGKRKNAWLGVLTWLGIQVVYLSVTFAGCDTMTRGMNFH